MAASSGYKQIPKDYLDISFHNLFSFGNRATIYLLDNYNLINWLMHNQLLASSVYCNICKGDKHLTKYNKSVWGIHTFKLKGIVELDESKFGHVQKYFRGRKTCAPIWIFGLVERDTNVLYLFPVNNRTEDTLVALINKVVEPGSTIYSDGWSSYANESQRSWF